jgi:hypothetical protein
MASSRQKVFLGLKQRGDQEKGLAYGPTFFLIIYHQTEF